MNQTNSDSTDVDQGHHGTTNSPISPQPQQLTPTPPVIQKRRNYIGWWIAIAGVCMLVGVVAVISAMLSWLETDNSNASSSTKEPSIAKYLETNELERARYYKLAARLDNNPVAPLVTQSVKFKLIEGRRDNPAMNIYMAKNLAEDTRQFRETLQQRIIDAEARSTNASGTLTESIVDSAGQGYIDIKWDATTACSTSEKPGRITTGCVSENPIGIHILPDNEMRGGDWGKRLVVLHELAHLYQRADLDLRAQSESSESMKLMDKGLFQDNSEKMADCYALTYLNEWSLSDGTVSLGYGYVCNESERQAIREWATGINAPMPK